MKRVVMSFVVGLCASAISAVIAPDGRPYTQIVVAENVPDSVKLAATEMQRYLKKMTGTELPIVHEATQRPVICIGEQPLLEAAGLNAKGLRSEGWACRTTNDFLAIYGEDYGGPQLFGMRNPWRWVECYNDELKLNAYGPSGTLSGVYEFLHRVAGFRFYMPGDDGTVVPEVPEFKVPALKLDGAPAVPWRWAWIAMLSQNKDTAIWSKQLGIGGRAPVQIIHSYDFMLEYKDSHPEYFALVDGKRDFTNLCAVGGGGHLCLTNPNLIQQWADKIIAWFDANPMMDVYPLAPSDGLRRICGCPNCQAELHADYPAEEQFSYHIWNFTQKVAAKVAEKHPNKYVGCLAYEKYRTPPRELDKMKNVAVMFCNWRAIAANPQYQKQIHDEIDTWASRVDRFYLWSWYLDHWPPLHNLPVVQLHVIQNELTWLLAHPNYGGEFIETEGRPNNPTGYARMDTPGMQHLGLYMTGRMYMDPSTNADDMLKEYCRLFYGPAEKPMLAFWTSAQKRREEVYAVERSPEPEALFNLEFMKALNVHMEAALAATAEGSVYRRRVEVINGEFQEGLKRIERMVGMGTRNGKLLPVANFGDVSRLDEEMFCGKDGGPADTPKTTIRYGCDRSGLYFRFIAYEPDMDSIVANIKENDNGDIWLDDCFEIFLYPDADELVKGYHIIINTVGSVFDGITMNASLAHDLTWQSNARMGFRKEDGYWIMDVYIPFESIGINDPNFAGPIAANFYRNRARNGNIGYACWNPTGRENHNEPKHFGRLAPKQ